MKKMTAIVAAILLALLFTACGSGSAGGSQTITFEDGVQMEMRIETKDSFQIMGLSQRVHTATEIWEDFRRYESGFREHYAAPFYHIAVYDREWIDDLRLVTIGAQYRGNRPDDIPLTIIDVPAAIWAVFSINGPVQETMWDAYARVVDEWGGTEWYDLSGFARDYNAPYLEVFPGGEHWEIWMPVLRR